MAQQTERFSLLRLYGSCQVELELISMICFTTGIIIIICSVAGLAITSAATRMVLMRKIVGHHQKPQDSI